MSADVRPATVADVPGLLAAYEWLFEPPGSRPASWDPARAEETLRGLLDADRAAVLVAGDGGDLAGFCTVYLDIASVRFGQRAWVEDLAVRPEQRSRGIGSRLLDAARAWALAHGATHLELDSADPRTEAHRFYLREGATHTSRSFGWELGDGS
jgi:GNAT superfamily N-acetyltransferase